MGDLEDTRELAIAVLQGKLTFPDFYNDDVGKELMHGLICHKPKDRLGSGPDGYMDIKNAKFFKTGMANATSENDLFDQIMGRELEPPVPPQDTLGDLNLGLAWNTETGPQSQSSRPSKDQVPLSDEDAEQFQDVM